MSQGQGGGRPTEYKNEFARMAEVACSDGATDAKLAKLFNVSEVTINAWKKKHARFLKSVKKGKDFWDCLLAEDSLKKRVTGYEYEETIKEPGEDGEMVVTKVMTKHIAPDVKACDIWLCNRQSDRWKKLKHVELTGNDGGPMIVEVTRFGDQTQGDKSDNDKAA